MRTLFACCLALAMLGCGSGDEPGVAGTTTSEEFGDEIERRIQNIEDNDTLSDEEKQALIDGLRQRQEVADQNVFTDDGQ